MNSNEKSRKKRKDRTNTIYYKIAHAVCSKYRVEEDTKYVAMFLDMMAFQIFEMLLILGTSIYLGIFIETVLVMMFFFSARIGRKGVHAKNRAICALISLVLIIGVSYIASIINPLIAPILGYLTGVLLRKRKSE